MKTALIGDIGATNARFAILRDGKPTAIQVLPVASYASLGDAIEAYFTGLEGGEIRPKLGAVAVAGPVTGDYLAFTNHPWSFSISGLTKDLKFDHLEVINDFVAVALAVPRIGPEVRRQVGAGAPVAGAPVGIIGPGSGLGVSIVVPVNEGEYTRWVPLAGEGGHVTLPPVTDREASLVAWLHRTGRQHVSGETLICGRGLTTLYAGLAALDGIAHAPLQPADVSNLALSGQDPIAVEAVEIFCALLGTVAGNLALTAGALGGVYIAGGIVPKLGDFFDRSQFRPRFVSKGRMRSYLEAVPTYVVTEPFPAFLGLAELVETLQRRHA
jgi:glucokinase